MHRAEKEVYIWRRRSLLLRHHCPRSIVFRVAVVAAVLLGPFHFLSLHEYYRNELRVKFSPTIFTYSSPEEAAEQESTIWKEGLHSVESKSRVDIVQHQSDWKRLGRGCEGDTFMYNGSVIKVYNEEKMPFRNYVPGSLKHNRWPTEIPATLLLGKLYLKFNSAGDIQSSFVPVMDYFLLSPDSKDSRWHFITPFLNLGNLYTLAMKIRASPEELTARTLDNIYRPSFDRILAVLHKLHAEYELCHDDVKPDNIFISSSKPSSPDLDLNATKTHWLLADLGNIRHLDHPYHSSFLWTPYNHQLRDCRANDALRLLKSYISFLRLATSDVAAFDEAFYAGSEPWSRLYWLVMEAMAGSKTEILSATSLRYLSEEVEAPGGYPHFSTRYGRAARGLWNPLMRLALGYEGTVARGVAGELATGMGLGDKWARFWALTWMRRVPVGGC
jgi:hypothetical protein